MNIEQQVCSREFSERLVKLGVTTHSYFAHKRDGINLNQYHVVPRNTLGCSGTCDQCYPAFTTSELGLLLGYGTSCNPKNTNEAQHRAKCLVQDLENFVFTADEANKRLTAA